MPVVLENLAHHPGFQQGAGHRPGFQRCRVGPAGQVGGQAGIEKLQLGRLDEALAQIGVASISTGKRALIVWNAETSVRKHMFYRADQNGFPICTTKRAPSGQIRGAKWIAISSCAERTRRWQGNAVCPRIGQDFPSGATNRSAPAPRSRGAAGTAPRIRKSELSRRPSTPSRAPGAPRGNRRRPARSPGACS